MFDADRPITKSSHDKLNRSTFAKYLARCLLDHKDLDSFVVGLYGGWGVGKTSIINMVVEEINFAATNIEDNEKPIILNFSPWSYSGQDQLIYSFFRRLSSVLRNDPNFKNSQRIIHLLELYVSFFSEKPVPKSLRTKRSLWQRLTWQGREEVYAWESGRDLTLVKAELNELLRNQQHKIIIIIDNISRLYAHEIKQMFQIVKSMGDYCNTAYLLSFDKEQVINAINQVDGSGGEEYIEKVIQLPFEIPAIAQYDLEKILADRLREVIETAPIDAWNTEYWADYYYNSLRYFFQNCRDITRYVNTVNFGYARLRDVVNPVDFFVLTAIEVFLPQVYTGISENKDLFTDLLDRVYEVDEDQRKKEMIRVDAILATNNRLPRTVLLDLLMRLFPRLHKIYQPEAVFYYSDSIARKDRRISSPDLFDAYFRLSIHITTISDIEFRNILATANNAETFDQALARLNQDDRMLQFLDKLDSKTIKTIPKDHVQNIISGLFDTGDFLPEGIHGAMSLDTQTRLHHIIHNLLQKFSHSDERFMILQNAIAKENKSIYTSVHELMQQGVEHLENSDTFLPLEYRDLTPEQLVSLRKLCISRIKIWAHNGSLAGHPKLLPILYAWRDWGDPEDCIRFVKSLTDTDQGLLIFLGVTLSKAIDEAATCYHKNPEWQNYLTDIDAFITAQMLVDHAKALFEDEYFEKLREREQLALMIFLDLLSVPTKKIIPKTST